MRAVLDVLRLLRSVLGFMGRYRAASAVGVVLAVGFIVFHAAAGAYAAPGHGGPVPVGTYVGPQYLTGAPAELWAAIAGACLVAGVLGAGWFGRSRLHRGGPR